MSKKSKVFAVVPAYNEEKRISKAIKDLNKYNYKGDFILQAARGNNDYNVAKSYYDFTSKYIRRHFSES